MANPYLQQTADAMRAQSNQNLQQTVIPQIQNGAMATGGFGGSRQAITQGIAAGNAEAGTNSAIANMYSQDYQQEQNRAMQQQLAQMQNATQMAGINSQYALGMGNLGLGYGNLANSMTQTGNNFQLGLGGLGLQQQGLNNNLALGMGGLGLQQQGLNNQFALGVGGLGIQQQGVNNQLALGMGNLGLGYQTANQNYQLGLGGLQNTAQANANNYALGAGNLGLGYLNANNNYNLGLGGLAINQQNANTNQMTAGGNLFQQGQNGLLQGGTALQQGGLNQQNSDWGPFQQYGNMLGTFGGFGQTNQQNGSGGSAFGNALGGAVAGAQLGNMFMGPTQTNGQSGINPINAGAPTMNATGMSSVNGGERYGPGGAITPQNYNPITGPNAPVWAGGATSNPNGQNAMNPYNSGAPTMGAMSAGGGGFGELSVNGESTVSNWNPANGSLGGAGMFGLFNRPTVAAGGGGGVGSNGLAGPGAWGNLTVGR